MLVLPAAVAVFCTGFIILMAIDAARWRELGRLWRLVRLASFLTAVSCLAVWLAFSNPNWHPEWQAPGFSGSGWLCQTIPVAYVCFQEQRINPNPFTRSGG